MSDPDTFAEQANLTPQAAQYLSGVQREIRFADDLARASGLAGLGGRAADARAMANQNRQELQRFCAQAAQSVIDRDQRQQRAEADRISAERARQAASEASKTAERQRQAVIEYELNRRVPGASELIYDFKFWNWLDSSQGKTLRSDVWAQAMSTENYDRAAQLLRDYKRTLKVK